MENETDVVEDNILKLLNSEVVSNKNNETPNEKIKRYLTETTKKYDEGAVILMKSPVETYFEVNVASVKSLIDNGFEGIYISFQRPFKNVSSLFEKQGIDINKLLIIDAATAFSCVELQEKNPKCVSITSATDIDELARIIRLAFQRLNSKKRFIFIDSLSTMSLYKSSDETTKFSELLVELVKQYDAGNIILMFNIAEDLSQKQFIKDIVPSVDEIIDLHYLEQHANEVINVV